MSMEWFDRISAELQDHLESICEKYDQVGHMSIDRGAKHPRIEFFVETEDDERDYFCTLCFDPYNVEFYIESFDFEYDQMSRTILSDIEEIIDAVHESFHMYMNDDDEEEYDESQDIEEDNVLEEIDVEWETPEVTAFMHEDEVEVTYQFGIIQETGDGVLKRINRIKTDDDQLIKDETNFIFSKEEASTIIAMIASHMDSLSEFDFQ
ncbi:hypothetical protein CHH83_22270 [Bacillus sp. 7586-K]|uniref:Uncharacterized protein n=1 Tax=Metabacillus niabensis TaxID=324854 RepID=A0ABT9Z8T1_9BACI|nr:hypothetical protein [Metabacillus niabensis]MDQ0228657.1 hypothetical protein [Metabacillus niabensis]PAD66795.1 hypothetical protein CHH83_22270 [Bacillus sp. 7586-K]